MIERGRELGFTLETNEIGSAVSEIGREDFDDRGPIERRIYDLVNSALSTFTDFFDDTIMEEELPEHRRKGIEPARAYSGQDLRNLQEADRIRGVCVKFNQQRLHQQRADSGAPYAV